MKKMILAATIALVSLIGAVGAQADHSRGINGLIIGAGSGAIAGQAIGRNTEATLIGTAVGGLLGYIVGNEIDKGRGYAYQPVYHRQPQPVYHRQPQPVVHHYAPKYKKKGPHHRPVVQHRVVEHHHYHPVVSHRPAPQPECRQAEILGTVNGKARKLYGTVCRTANGWELVSDPYGSGAVGSGQPTIHNQYYVDQRF